MFSHFFMQEFDSVLFFVFAFTSLKKNFFYAFVIFSKGLLYIYMHHYLFSLSFEFGGSSLSFSECCFGVHTFFS